MFAPDIFSLKFDDDLFKNLKIEIMKNEKWKNASSLFENGRTVNISFNCGGLIYRRESGGGDIATNEASF